MLKLPNDRVKNAYNLLCLEHNKMMNQIRIIPFNQPGKRVICQSCQSYAKQVYTLEEANKQYQSYQDLGIKIFAEAFKNSGKIIKDLEQIKQQYKAIECEYVSQLVSRFIESLSYKQEGLKNNQFPKEMKMLTLPYLESYAKYLSLEQEEQIYQFLFDECKKLQKQFDESYNQKYGVFINQLNLFCKEINQTINNAKQINRQYQLIKEKDENLSPVLFFSNRESESKCKHTNPILINLNPNAYDRIICNNCLAGQRMIGFEDAKTYHINAFDEAVKKDKFTNLIHLTQQIKMKNFHNCIQQLEGITILMNDGQEQLENFAQEINSFILLKEKTKIQTINQNNLEEFAQEHYKIFKDYYQFVLSQQPQISSENKKSEYYKIMVSVQEQFIFRCYQKLYNFYIEIMKKIQPYISSINSNFCTFQEKINFLLTEKQLSDSIAITFNDIQSKQAIIFDQNDKYFLKIIANEITLYQEVRKNFFTQLSNQYSFSREQILACCLQIEQKWFAIATGSQIIFGEIRKPDLAEEKLLKIQKQLEYSEFFQESDITKLIADQYTDCCYSRSEKKICIWKKNQAGWQMISIFKDQFQPEWFTFKVSPNISFLCHLMISSQQTLKLISISKNNKQEISAKNQIPINLLLNRGTTVKSIRILKTYQSQNNEIMLLIMVYEKEINLVQIDLARQTGNLLQRFKNSKFSLELLNDVSQQGNILISYCKEKVKVFKLNEDPEIANKYKLTEYAQIQKSNIVDCQVSLNSNYLSVLEENNYLVIYSLILIPQKLPTFKTVFVENILQSPFSFQPSNPERPYTA